MGADHLEAVSRRYAIRDMRARWTGSAMARRMVGVRAVMEFIIAAARAAAPEFLRPGQEVVAAPPS